GAGPRHRPRRYRPNSKSVRATSILRSPLRILSCCCPRSVVLRIAGRRVEFTLHGNAEPEPNAGFRLHLPHCAIRLIGECLQRREKLLRLACKQSARRQSRNRSPRARELIGQRTDRRAQRKIRADELSRNREDQARLRLIVEVGEEVGEVTPGLLWVR